MVITRELLQTGKTPQLYILKIWRISSSLRILAGGFTVSGMSSHSAGGGRYAWKLCHMFDDIVVPNVPHLPFHGDGALLLQLFGRWRYTVNHMNSPIRPPPETRMELPNIN